jgi:ribose/xylose/arabinose/galactoside ABC-type transport system permease subunit
MTTTRLPWQWAGVLPAVWSAHIGAMYVLQSMHCLDGVLGGELAGVAWVRIASIIVTLACLALAVVGMLRMLALHRQAEDEATEYFSLGTCVVSGMLAVYLLWALVPALAYPTCPG